MPKAKRIAAAGFLLSGFLFLCAVINLAHGQLGGAIASLGSGIFFASISVAAYKKEQQP